MTRLRCDVDISEVFHIIYGRRNFRKHRDVKGIENYVTLDILLKFDSLDKMRITSSESKEKLEISGKGLVNSLSIKAKNKSKEVQKGKVYHCKFQ